MLMYTRLYTALVATLATSQTYAILCSEAEGLPEYSCTPTQSFNLAASASVIADPSEFSSICCEQDACKRDTGDYILEVFHECPSGIDPRTTEKVYVDVNVFGVGGSVLSNANLLLTNTITGEDIEFAYGGTTTFALNVNGSYEISVLDLDGYVVQSETGVEKVSGTPLTDDNVADGVYILNDVSVDTVVEWVYEAPQVDREVVIRAEDDSGTVIAGARVKVTDTSTGTSVIYASDVSDAEDWWDAATGTFFFTFPSNSQHEFEILLPEPNNLIATNEIGGDNNYDGKTVITISEDTSVTFVYSEETTCQIAFFDNNGVCGTGFTEKGWKACYGVECTEDTCCGERTCLTETDHTLGSICVGKKPKDDFSTIVCGEGTGETCTAERCCSDDDLPPLEPHIPDQCSDAYLNIDFEDVAGLGYADDSDLDGSYRPEGISFALTTTGSFTPYNLRSAPRVEATGGPRTMAGFVSSCNLPAGSGNKLYDYDYNDTLGNWFLKLVGLDSNEIPVMPSLLVTYNTHGSTQAAGMLYDIDGGASRQEQYQISIYDEDRNLLGSDFSIRGTTNNCVQNEYEATYWQFVVNSTNDVPIKYLRIDYIGMGQPKSIGMGFDNFRAYGCTKDARVLNAFTTGV